MVTIRRVLVLLGVAVLCLVIVAPASAQYGYYGGSSMRLGNFTYHNLDNGVTGTSMQLGNFTYHNFSNGATGTSMRIGNSTFHDFNMPCPVPTYSGYRYYGGYGHR